MISKIEDAIAAIKNGEMIIVVDNEDRENEGDIVIASEAITPQAIAFMMTHARGLICSPMEGKRLDDLDIPLMVANNTEAQKTAFTVSVDFVHGTSTGISAYDRAATIRALTDPRSKPTDFARPGHIFPLRANPMGVLGRQGHTEAAVDLARLAGFVPAGAICEIAGDDGRMLRLPELEKFAKQHDLLIITIADLITYREKTEKAPAAYADAELSVAS